MNNKVDPPNSRDIIIKTIEESPTNRADWLADKILKNLAAAHLHVMKYKGSEL